MTFSAAHLRNIAVWSRDLGEADRKRVLQGLQEKDFAKGTYICRLGDRFGGWAGVVSGLVKLATVTKSGNAVTFAGLPAGAWFGEGSVIKNEPRRYDIVALRDTRLAVLDRQTFMWLFENNMAFARFLVHHLNERVSQFMAMVENDRTPDPPAKLAHCIGWLFNPILCPSNQRYLAITQDEFGFLSGMSRTLTNKSLQTLQNMGLIRIEHGGVTVLDLNGLFRLGE